MNFPRTLAEVPENERLPQVHGFMGPGFGLGGLIVAVGQLIDIARFGFNLEMAKWSGGALVVGLLCGVFTWLDLKSPLVLVRRGEEMGAYRSGQFVTAFPVTRVGEYRLSWVNTFRGLMSFGLLGPISFFAVFTFPIGTMPFFWCLGIAVALNLSAVGIVRERIMSRHYLLPDTVSCSEVAFTKSALRRVGLIR